MKTKELLDKYQKLIGGLLKVDPKMVKFYVFNGPNFADWIEIGSIFYEKKSEDIIWDWCIGDYKVEVNSICISTFQLYQMPHCCAFLISCKSFVNSEFRNKRIATTLNSMRQDIGRILGYSALLCTDIDKNEYQRKLLATNGWKDIYYLVNKRTENRVYLSVINL